MTEINDNYIDKMPSIQNIVDVFADKWISSFPPNAPCKSGGNIPLFQDPRIAWLIQRLGGSLKGKSVAELGPFEGGHTYMLAQADAKRIVGIEGNTLNLLKTLVVKDIFKLDKLELLCGELEKWLASKPEKFDLLVASGVLYHFNDPLMALRNMALMSDNIFIWTHFVHKDLMQAGDSRLAPFTGETTQRTVDGYTATYHKRSYHGSQNGATFCGGILSDSVWMTHNDIVYAFHHWGFLVEEVMLTADHPNGPCSCFFASKIAPNSKGSA